MRDIKKVLVLGANGTMGSGAAGLFASRGYEVAALARTADKAREGLRKAKEAVRSDVIERSIRCGSYEESLEKEVAAADLVLECVAEDLPTKRRFFEVIDKARRPGTVISTVSSGLSIAEMIRGRSEDFRRHFMGIHLFNPPHVIVGTEIIAGPDTDREVLLAIKSMLRKRLGRVVVECRDMPAFAGNRIGFKVLNEVAQLAEEHGVATMDYLIGPYTGRAMPPLATIDLVGWDVHKAIVDNVYMNTNDEAHGAFRMPGYMHALLERGHLGNKTPKLGGFFRRGLDDGRKTLHVLDPKSGEYVLATSVERVGFVEDTKRLHNEGRYAEAISTLLGAKGPEAELVRKVVLGYVSYGLNRVGFDEVAADVGVVDGIMGSGFNWAPPGVLVDLIGTKAAIAAMEASGIQVPKLLLQLSDADLLAPDAGNIGRYFVAK